MKSVQYTEVDLFSLDGQFALVSDAGPGPGLAQAMTVYLASRASDYINGTILAVDGEWFGR